MNGLVTILTVTDNKDISFLTTSSTFHSLAAQADDKVNVETSIDTTTGSMYLDGDYENQASDSSNKVVFPYERTLTAKTIMTLESTTGAIEGTAKFTLSAGDSIVILDN